MYAFARRDHFAPYRDYTCTGRLKVYCRCPAQSATRGPISRRGRKTLRLPRYYALDICFGKIRKVYKNRFVYFVCSETI